MTHNHFPGLPSGRHYTPARLIPERSIWKAIADTFRLAGRALPLRVWLFLAAALLAIGTGATLAFVL